MVTLYHEVTENVTNNLSTNPGWIKSTINYDIKM